MCIDSFVINKIIVNYQFSITNSQFLNLMIYRVFGLQLDDIYLTSPLTKIKKKIKFSPIPILFFKKKTLNQIHDDYVLLYSQILILEVVTTIFISD